MDRSSCFALISTSAALIFASSRASIAVFATPIVAASALSADMSSMGRSFHGELMRVESASYPIGMARLLSPSACCAVPWAAGGGLGLFIRLSRHGALRCSLGWIVARFPGLKNVCFGGVHT